MVDSRRTGHKRTRRLRGIPKSALELESRTADVPRSGKPFAEGQARRTDCPFFRYARPAEERRMIEITFPKSSGLDVHKKTVTACVMVPKPRGGGFRPVNKTFPTPTSGLRGLAQWLHSYG